MTHTIIMTMNIATGQNASERTERAAHAAGIYSTKSWEDFRSYVITLAELNETVKDIVTQCATAANNCQRVIIDFADDSRLTLIETTTGITHHDH